MVYMNDFNVKNVRCFLGDSAWDQGITCCAGRKERHFCSRLFATEEIKHGKDSHVLAGMTTGIKMAQTYISEMLKETTKTYRNPSEPF